MNLIKVKENINNQMQENAKIQIGIVGNRKAFSELYTCVITQDR
jgi:hypothetical protein